ncbi:hypothetical protein O181_132676 [Austropuccinia psidii MF-1]|uniref:Uncharacterized protein n=1 Tax=Austropuccinia psidii MF-1 TaxID=1389203 RepID=A0A9Q3L6S8_9BASI|nr:hypothetical protein [Austropuccinia psidii MF-1]
MEDARTSTSSQRLASTFEPLFESPKADITAIHQGKSRINRWRLTSRRTAASIKSCFTSRQRQSSHVSHENVTQSPKPFQHYSQCSGNFTSLASASPPNLPQCFACLQARTALQMRLQHCPHHSLRFHTPAHTIFMRTWCTPDTLPTSLILTLAQVPSRYAPNTAYDYYACGVHS